MEPLRNEEFCYIEVLFHIFYYYWDKENRSLCRGLRYVEVPYIEDCVIKWFINYIGVPLYNETSLKRTIFANLLALRCKEVLLSSSINGITLIAA